MAGQRLLLAAGLLAFGMMGAVAPAALAGKDSKVTICHKRGAVEQTRLVAAQTVQHHLAHGDTLGACDTTGDSAPATAYQNNAAHTGASDDAVAPTPVKRWTVNLGGAISYPLIVGDRVYVTVANTDGYGTKLVALDASSGATVWGPKDLGGTYYWSGLTYDAGQVFAVNYDGVMRAYDAASGTLSWTTQLAGQYAFTSAPTARDGYVYAAGAGSGGTLYAVRQSDGAMAWTAPVANGDNSSPAVSSGGVYVSYACGQSYAFNPASGGLIWQRSTGCSGGGGKTPVLAHGELFVRDHSFPAVLDAATGAELRMFQSSGPAPAIDATSRFVLDGSSTLRAETASSGAVRWTFSGDGSLSSAPIVAGDTVFAGSATGNLYALSADTGAVTWSTNVGAGIPAPDEQNVSQPLTGLAASGGLLVVPAGTTLVAYR